MSANSEGFGHGADLHIVGIVCREEAALCDYVEIRDEDYRFFLTDALLKFEGMRVEVAIKVIAE